MSRAGNELATALGCVSVLCGLAAIILALVARTLH